MVSSTGSPSRRSAAINSLCVPMPAPRPARGSPTRSKTVTSQPILRSAFAAKRPAIEPPITSARRAIASVRLDLRRLDQHGVGAQLLPHELVELARRHCHGLGAELREALADLGGLEHRGRG